jgi:hypothetical protein
MSPDDAAAEMAELAARLSPLQTNPSVGPPVMSNAPGTSDSKTWNRWTSDPWVIKAQGGNDLAQFGAITTTLVRAIDTGTGALVVYATYAFQQKSLGYFIRKREPQKDGILLRVHFLDQGNGVLHSWLAEQKHIVNCEDNGAFTTFREELTPDWYDDCVAVLLIAEPSWWRRC